MVYHHYPISELGQKIAEALEAAGEQGKFWELHDRLIEDVPTDIFELKACAGNPEKGSIVWKAYTIVHNVQFK